MFGGLELKGAAAAAAAAAKPSANGTTTTHLSQLDSATTTTNTADTAAAAAAAAAATATATASSAFSFLNFGSSVSSEAPGIPSPTTNTTDQVGIVAAATTTTAPENCATAMSAFGFLSSPAEAAAAAAAAAPTATATTVSSFDFLQGSGVGTNATTAAAAASEDLWNATSTTAAAATATSHAFDTKSVSSMSADSTPIMPSMEPSSLGTGNTDWSLGGSAGTTTTFGVAAPVGAGVVFGGAAAVVSNANSTAAAITGLKQPIKKRTRTAKIGAAALASSSAPPPTTTPTPERKPALPSSTTTSTVRGEALEATRRAEEFLHEKVSAASNNSTSSASTSNNPHLTIRSVPSEEDEVIAAAKAAAKEAHKLEAQKSAGFRSSSSSSGNGSGTSAFGSLFRSRAKSPPSTSMRPVMSMSASSASSSNDLDMSTSSTIGRPLPSSSSAAERLQREQEDVKRAMAERSWRMMQQQPHIHASAISEDSADNEPTTAAAAPNHSLPVPPHSHSTTAAPSTFNSTLPSTAPAKSLMVQVKSAPVVDVIASLPKPVTARDKLDQMLEDFRRQVVRSMNEMTRLRQQRTGLLEERFVTNAKERLAGQQKARALAQQAAAAEAEDFELADTMSTMIDRHGQEQAEYAAILENIGRAIRDSDAQKNVCVNDVTRYFHDIQEKLRAVQGEQETADSKNATESLDKFSTMAKQLSAENERLQNDWKHLERDTELVAEERHELEKAISEQSGTFEKLRDQARGKLATVEEEIEELRLRLQAKQAVAAELRTEAAGHDESVLKVRVKFARQLTRLQKKEMTIKDNTEEWESEKRSFETQKQQHELLVQEHAEAMLARDKLLEDIHQEIEVANTFASIVAKEIGFEVNAGRDEPESDNELAQRQANVVKGEAAVTEAKAGLKSIVAGLNSLEQEAQTLTLQIPQLEELKKTAAERRDFKAAGKASKDIKEATARLAECTCEMETERVRKEAAEGEVSRLQTELEQVQAIAQAMERESALATMERLANHIQQLVATKHQVCHPTATTTPSQQAPRSVTSVGAFVLEAQIKVLKLEGQSIGEKYGGWTELMSAIEGGDDENEASKEGAAVGETSPAATEPESIQESGTEAKENAISPPNTSTEAATTTAASSPDKKRQFRAVTQRLGECEQQLEAAVAEDDFDKAAELDEVLQQLLAEVQALNMTDEEMALALEEPDEPILDSNTAVVDDPATYDEPTDEEPPPQPTDEPTVEEPPPQPTDEPTDEESPPQPTNGEAVTEPTEPDQNEEAMACNSTNGTAGDTGGNIDQDENAVAPDNETVANDTATAEGETPAVCEDGATPLNEIIDLTDTDAVHEESNATPIPNDDDEINDTVNDMNGEQQRRHNDT